jgi:hypothetical protein
MMRPEDFDAHLEAFARTKAWEMCERESPVSAEELLEYEQSAGVTLPPEYVHVANTFGPGQFGFAEVFSVRPGEWCIDVHRATAPALPAEFVPISDNGCGDFYGFLVRNGRCESRLVFAAHEEGYALKPTEFADLYEYLQRYGI